MKAALIVIDMQNDYLWAQRKQQFAYDTPALVGAVNTLIHKYHDAGQDVIYIRHLIQNLPTNKLLFGYSLKGTQGAELYSGLDIVSDLCYDKYFPDALTNKALRSLIAERGIDTLHLCGLDECGCVSHTALGAVKRGLKAEILAAGTATVLPEKKVAAMRARREQAGIRMG